jgi:hypothetical protein
MKPVWINGVRYDSAGSAAARLSFLLGWKVDSRWADALVKAGISMTVNGVRIGAVPPENRQAPRLERPPAERSEAAGPAVSRPPLLRYPRGTAPIDRGAPHARA